MKHFNMLCNGQKIRKKFEYKKKKKTFERFSAYALLSKEESAALRTALLSVNAVIITANWLPLYQDTSLPLVLGFTSSLLPSDHIKFSLTKFCSFSSKYQYCC